MIIPKQIFKMHKITNILRNLIFITFWILSIRSVLVYLNYLTGSVQLFGIIAVLIGIALCWWKIIWVLYLFIGCIPLISGIQELGFMKSVPLVSFLFAIIYISWFINFFFWRKKSLILENIISNFMDILTGVVYLSIFFSLCLYPLDYSLYRLQYASIMGQFDPFWFMEAGYIVLQGMFFYRIFELELKDKDGDRKFIIPCIYFHTIIVLFFTFREIIVTLIDKKKIDFIFSPFQDPHSYGGYILILLFFFAYIVFQKKKNSYIEILFVLSFLLCIFLSGSSAAVISLFFIGAIWGVIALLKRKKIVLLVSFIIGTMILLYSIPGFVPKNNFVLKYASRLNYTSVLELKTVTERFELWSQALGILKEFPFTGSGVGSYFKISNYYSNNSSNSGELRNAHNYYFQFAAELGIPALFLLLCILFFVFRTAFQTPGNHHSKGLLLGVSAYLLSMLTGHHLILSVQQFLFWFVLFAIVYSTKMDLKKQELNVESKYLFPILCAFIFFILAAHVFTLVSPKKEIKGLYEYGLYQTQMVNNDKMRWIGKHSRKKVNAKTDYFSFSMYAEPENCSSGILEMKIYVNDQLLDQLIWEQKGTKHKNYHIPGIKGTSLKIRTSASESYNPFKRGLSKNIRENRDQSAAMTEIVFFQDSNYKIK